MIDLAMFERSLDIRKAKSDSSVTPDNNYRAAPIFSYVRLESVTRDPLPPYLQFLPRIHAGIERVIIHLKYCFT